MAAKHLYLILLYIDVKTRALYPTKYSSDTFLDFSTAEVRMSRERGRNEVTRSYFNYLFGRAFLLPCLSIAIYC